MLIPRTVVRPALYVLSCVSLIAATSCAHSPKQPSSTFDLEAGKLIVPVTINGKKLRFMLDTGDKSDGSICSEHVSALNLTEIPGKAVRVGGWGGNKKEWPLRHFYSAHEVKIGTSSFQQVELIEEQSCSSNFDGVIGIGTLKQRRTLIDYVSHQISFPDHEVTLTYSVPFVFQNESDILVTAKIEQADASNFLLDTGASLNHISKELGVQLGLKTIAGKSVEIRDLLGNSEQTSFLSANNFCLGALCRRNVELVAGQFHQNRKSYKRSGILGTPFLDGHRWLIDFSKKVLFYE
ncbi:MAG TPA: retroviral-like aspartic protease family protein [Bdellovibrionota bacterium]|nr:retroviral-like aspartic protease family protein [Bdellovibrionota bacterium]